MTGKDSGRYNNKSRTTLLRLYYFHTDTSENNNVNSGSQGRVPRVLRELQSQKHRQSKVLQVRGEIPTGASPIGRLQYVWQTFPFDAAVVAQAMRFKAEGLFFCDSTLFIAETSPLIWDAMTDRNEIALIPRIINEISKWIDDAPSLNQDAHARIKARLSGDTKSGVQVIVKPDQEWMSKGVWYYADLLGVRKLMWHIAEDDLGQRMNRAPTGQEVSNHIQQVGTSRAQLLAKQGRDPKVPGNLFNDEWLVATALCYAIASGIEVTLVTGDEAVLDQFAKATVMLTRHYEAMHFSHCIVHSPRSFVVTQISNPDKDLFRSDKIDLVRNPYSSPRDFLPADYHPVQVHCMLLQSTVTRCTFQAEQEMAVVLQKRHQTNGLCTDQLSGRNLHIDPPCVVRAKHADVAVVASDVAIDAGGTIPISFTDIEHSLRNGEEVEDVKWVDPRVLLLPPQYGDQ
jgi:hypothetical protein